MPKKSTANKLAELNEAAELSAHIAAVLAHPRTPPRLHTAIAQELAVMYSDIPAKESFDTSEMIERVLNWHEGAGFRNA
jgi:hypothetical protein